jgi:hypothetical protein
MSAAQCGGPSGGSGARAPCAQERQEVAGIDIAIAVVVAGDAGDDLQIVHVGNRLERRAAAHLNDEAAGLAARVADCAEHRDEWARPAGVSVGCCPWVESSHPAANERSPFGLTFLRLIFFLLQHQSMRPDNELGQDSVVLPFIL